MKKCIPSFLAVTIFLSACQTRLPQIEYTPVDFEKLPGWKIQNIEASQKALRRSCTVSLKKAGDVYQPFCEDLLEKPHWPQKDLRALLKKHFQAYQMSVQGQTHGQFTGYYEPELRGSRKKSPQYSVPLYKLPPSSVDYKLPRAQIVAGALANKGLELVWVDSPEDAFFLQIQGSGRVVLENGEVLRLGYVGTNGFGYTPIGKALVEKGVMTVTEVSMQRIKSWLREHPDQAEDIMSLNESYVFFRILEGEGPIGAQGVAVEPGHSLAVDPRFTPLGTILWVDIDHPDDQLPDLQNIMVAQDKGGGIKGPLRGDYFWGFGKRAEEYAGRMNSKGRLFALKPKSNPPQPQK